MIVSNFLIFLDLSLVLRYPFNPGEPRLKYYFAFIILMISADLFYPITSDYVVKPIMQYKKDGLFSYATYIHYSLRGLFEISTLLVFLDAMRLLIKKGTSSGLKKKVFF